MKNSCEGILYPADGAEKCREAFAHVRCSGPASLPGFITVPHCSWQMCFSDIVKALSSFEGCRPDRIVLLAPLHKGPVEYDSAFCVYTPEKGVLEGSDWKMELCPVEYDMVTEDNDICSEEHSLEIVAPFLSELFPGAGVSAFFAPGYDDKLVNFVDFLLKDFPHSLFLISNSTEHDCCAMWLRALRQNGVSI